MVLKLAVAACCLAFGGEALAQDSLELRRPGWLPSVRAEGMGGAAVGVGDDEYAISTNPGGTGRDDASKTPGTLRGFQAPNIFAAVNASGASLLKKLPGGVKNAADLRNLILEARDNSVSYGRLSVFPFVTLWRFQVGLLFDQSLTTVLRKLPAPQTSTYDSVSGASVDTLVELEARRSSGVAAGISFPYVNTGLSIGANARFLTHNTLRQSLEANDGVLGAASEAASQASARSNSLAFDAGLLLKKTVRGFRFGGGLVARDIMDTRYKSGSSVLATDRMSFAIGTSAARTFEKKVTFQFAADLEGLAQNGAKLKDGVRLGVEAAYGEDAGTAPLSVRLGHDLQSWTAGISANLLFFRLDLARRVAPVRGAQADARQADSRLLGRMTVDLRM